MNLRVQIIDDDVRIAEIHRQYVEKTEGFFSQQKWCAWVDLQDFKRYYDLQTILTENSLKKLVLENG